MSVKKHAEKDSDTGYYHCLCPFCAAKTVAEISGKFGIFLAKALHRCEHVTRIYGEEKVVEYVA